MNRTLFVFVLAFLLGARPASSLFAQSPALQKGVSVQMASTNNAMPMPEADDQGAWIVSVNQGGKLYFGTQPVTSDELIEQMRIRPRLRMQKLYIKADSRASYADVQGALEGAKKDLFEDAILLTNQTQSQVLGTLAPPKGLQVMLAAPGANAEPVVVEMNYSERQPVLKLNGNDVSTTDLQDALNRAFQNRSEKVLVLKADGRLPFAQVVHVVDDCRSVGATVVIATPDL